MPIGLKKIKTELKRLEQQATKSIGQLSELYAIGLPRPPPGPPSPFRQLLILTRRLRKTLNQRLLALERRLAAKIPAQRKRKK